MKKGISPVVSVVILIGIAASAAISVYYWVGSFQSQPNTPEAPKEISVSVIECNSGGTSKITIRDISNPGTEPINQTEKELIASNSSLNIGNCTPGTIHPGETMGCDITGFDGTISIYGNGTDIAATQVTC